MANHVQIPVLMLFYESQKDGLDVFEQLKKDSPSIASYLSVNVKNNPEVAKTFKVVQIPTFLILKNGKECWRHSGGTSIELIKNNLALIEPINNEAFI
ncbi:thioredoxin family protein [Flectobacillus major]|jgi:thioredoxin-like negative regulator of GroEL|uniref:thioredoxin family protein n=1 Tax=Flectobacillus major TaxID=103 RepID=UPI0005C72E78|nr:thioredoxin family protein [Flectobacillus major]